MPLVYVLVLHFSRSQPPRPNCQRHLFLYCCYMCIWFRGCPVVLHVVLSVTARCRKSRVLLHARRLLRVAAARGSLRHRVQRYTQSERSKVTIWAQSKYQKVTIFQVKLPLISRSEMVHASIVPCLYDIIPVSRMIH